MPDQIHAGKSRLYSITVPMSNGGTDTTSTVSFANPAPTFLQVRLNPANNREFAITCIAGGANTSVTVTCAGFSASVPVQTLAAPAPVATGIVIGPAGDEIDPPSWT